MQPWTKIKAEEKAELSPLQSLGVQECAVLCCFISDHIFSQTVIVDTSLKTFILVNIPLSGFLAQTSPCCADYHKQSRAESLFWCSCCFIPSCSSQWERASRATATIQTLLDFEALHSFGSLPSAQPNPSRAWPRLGLCWLQGTHKWQPDSDSLGNLLGMWWTSKMSSF